MTPLREGDIAKIRLVPDLADRLQAINPGPIERTNWFLSTIQSGGAFDVIVVHQNGLALVQARAFPVGHDGRLVVEASLCEVRRRNPPS
jgi:hypothetical protein